MACLLRGATGCARRVTDAEPTQDHIASQRRPLGSERAQVTLTSFNRPFCSTCQGAYSTCLSAHLPSRVERCSGGHLWANRGEAGACNPADGPGCGGGKLANLSSNRRLSLYERTPVRRLRLLRRLHARAMRIRSTGPAVGVTACSPRSKAGESERLGLPDSALVFRGQHASTATNGARPGDMKAPS